MISIHQSIKEFKTNIYKEDKGRRRQANDSKIGVRKQNLSNISQQGR
jgi:hypothetical protein